MDLLQDPDGLSKGKHEHEAWFVPRGKNKCQVGIQQQNRSDFITKLFLGEIGVIADTIDILHIFMRQVIEDMEHAIQMGLRAEEIVYTFQLPHPRWSISHRIKQKTYFPKRDGRELDYSRWQQSLIGVLMIDIEYDEEVCWASWPDLTWPN